MTILILGGNGFIGSAVLGRLAAEGHNVTGLGRNIRRAQLRYPQAEWLEADLSTMTSAEDWVSLVAGHEVVVNCAGALQDGLSDDLAAVQERAMLALQQAARSAAGRLIVQISARTDGPAADLPFLATKRRADEALKHSGVDHVILRPALVVGRNAHGGTALIRALAGFPRVMPVMHADSPVSTVALDDVGEAVVRAVDGRLPPGSDLALASDETHSLSEVLTLHRRWLGLPDASLRRIPAIFARPVTALADLAGKLGWRSPMRSTALTVMEGGGVESSAQAAVPFPLKSLQQTLADNPCGVQDLWFARLYLLKAPIIVMLSLFWLVSGLVPLFSLAVAMAHFDGLLGYQPALITVLATCSLDVALGMAVLVRRVARLALLGMMLTSLVYLIGASLAQFALWFDPLGPLVKVLPSLALTAVALAILDER